MISLAQLFSKSKSRNSDKYATALVKIAQHCAAGRLTLLDSLKQFAHVS
jgi:hypothetical protein